MKEFSRAMNGSGTGCAGMIDWDVVLMSGMVVDGMVGAEEAEKAFMSL